MIGGLVFLVVAILVVFILAFTQFSHMKHKFHTLVIVGILLFFLVSGVMVFSGKNIDFSSPEGIFEAGKLYFSFLGVLGKNVFSITNNAIKMDWNPDLDSNSSKQ